MIPKIASLLLLAFLGMASTGMAQLGPIGRIHLMATRTGEIATLVCTSSQEYPNGGYSYRHSLRRRGSIFWLNLKEVKSPEIGTRNPGPARLLVDLGELKEGTYYLFLRTGDAKGVTDYAVIKVDWEEVFVYPLTDNFVE